MTTSTTTPIQYTREDWLKTAADLILGEYLAQFADIRESISVRVSVGYAPNTKVGTKVLGACLHSDLSTEGHNEIFITPEENNSVLVLCVLTHELIHAINNNADDHSGEFKDIALKAGFARPLRELHPTESLVKAMTEYVELLGEIPHAKVDASLFKPKQKGRNLKCVCSDAKCGFKFNTSRTQIQRMIDANNGDVPCLVCYEPMILGV